MAAPVATVRQTPTGRPLQDGYKTLITFARYPAVSFWEKSVKPAGIDGGDPVDTTTMHNTTWRTKAPRGLKDSTNGTCKVAYDPAVIATITDMVNQPDTITVRFSDGSTEARWGFLKSFDPDEIVEGTQPEATVEFVFSNWDHVNDVEAGPTVVSVAGT